MSLASIAARTRLDVDGTEFLLMKALSLHLIEATIDEIEGTVDVTWVQPRVLMIPQIAALKGHLESWMAKVRAYDCASCLCASSSGFLRALAALPSWRSHNTLTPCAARFDGHPQPACPPSLCAMLPIVRNAARGHPLSASCTRVTFGGLACRWTPHKRCWRQRASALWRPLRKGQLASDAMACSCK